MPLPLIPQCVEAALHFAVAESTLAHVFHFRSTASTVTLADCNAVVDMLVAWVEEFYSPVLSNQIHLVDITARARDSYTGPEAAANAATPGQVSAPIFNLTECMVISLRGGLIGRAHHGKVYVLPANTASRADNYYYTTGYTNLVLTAFQELSLQASLTGTPWVVGSGRYGFTTPITSVSTTQRIAIQSRRGKPR